MVKTEIAMMIFKADKWSKRTASKYLSDNGIKWKDEKSSEDWHVFHISEIQKGEKIQKIYNKKLHILTLRKIVDGNINGSGIFDALDKLLLNIPAYAEATVIPRLIATQDFKKTAETTFDGYKRGFDAVKKLMGAGEKGWIIKSGQGNTTSNQLEQPQKLQSNNRKLKIY